MDNYDFSGWATRANLKCSDGRVIMNDAFAEDDGKVVPLVWNHDHNDPTNVLGHALLKNKGDGVYAYCTFNDSESGQTAKLLVKHGDVNALSICANQLKQIGHNVTHGVIREVSLVLANANPGAKIENVMIHGEEMDDEAVIYTGEYINLEHAEKEEEKEETGSEKTVKDVMDSLDEDQQKVVYGIIGELLSENDSGSNNNPNDNMEHADSGDKTIKEIINTLTEEQKKAVYAIIGGLMSEESNDGGNEDMKHNVFDMDQAVDTTGILMHSDGTPVTVDEIGEIFSDMKRYGSLKDACLNHGIDEVDYLFPDDRTITPQPGFIQRDMGWVTEVMNTVHHTPFSRIKSVFADITEDDARAKGYIKGRMKKEEFFGLIKRRTEPTTVYKKQKMDRDDMIDITDFDVVSWLKTEMRMMLNEELARAYLIGDGRLASSDDKINEQNIRPIAMDDDLFTVHVDVEVGSSATDDEKAKALIHAVIKNRKLYKGSGNPVLFTTEDMLTDMLLLTDEIGRDLYADEAALARKLRARKIVTVPVMENANGKGGNPLVGILVNMNDYNVGADSGGAVNMFDDFDIDYNQQKYLIETRCSGALTVPYSAIAFEMKTNG